MRKLKIPGWVFFDKFEFYNDRAFTLDGIRGRLYYLCNPITPDQAAILARYSNVRTLHGRTEYAPEIKQYYLFIGSKCFNQGA